MAEILAGCAGHKTYAPLSQAQTIEVCQHLQLQITNLQAELHDVRSDFGHVGETVINIRNGLENTNLAVSSVKDGLHNTNLSLDQIKKEFGKAKSKLHTLGMAQDKTGDSVQRMWDGQIVLKAEYTELKSGLQHINASVQGVQRQLDNSELNTLKDNQAQAMLRLQKVEDDHAGLKSMHLEQRDALRSEAAKVQAACDNLTKTNTTVHRLEQRVSESHKNLKDMRQNLEDVHLTVVKVKEDHENTKVVLSDCSANLKRTNAHMQQVHDGLNASSQSLSSTQAKLEETIRKLNKIRTDLNETLGSVKSLREGQDRVREAQRAIQANLDQTDSSLQLVKQGLKETNNIVLPNLVETSNSSQPFSESNQQQKEEPNWQHFSQPPSEFTRGEACHLRVSRPRLSAGSGKSEAGMTVGSGLFTALPRRRTID